MAAILLNIALIANPIGLIIAAAVILIGILALLYFKWDWFHDKVNATYEWIRDHWRLVGALILAPFLGPLAIAIVNIDRLARAFSPLLDVAANVLGWIWDKLKSIADMIMDVVNAVKWAIDQIDRIPGVGGGDGAGIFDFLPDWVPGLPRFIPGLPGGITGLAGGGMVTSGGWAMVGEKGPEFMRIPFGASVHPIQSASVVPLDGSNALGGGIREIRLRVPVVIDGREVAEAVANYNLDELARR